MKKLFVTAALFCIAQIPYVLCAFCLADKFENEAVKASAADCVMLGTQRWFVYTYITILAAIFILREIKSQKRYNIILRADRHGKMYMVITAKVIFVSIVMAVVHITLLVLWGMISGRNVINWNVPTSVYRTMTGSVSDVSFLSFILFCTVGNALGFGILSMILMTVSWTHGNVVALAALLVLYFAERKSGLNILTGTIIPQYSTICSEHGIEKSLFAGICMLLILILLFKFAMKRKEYFSEQR